MRSPAKQLISPTGPFPPPPAGPHRPSERTEMIWSGSSSHLPPLSAARLSRTSLYHTVLPEPCKSLAHLNICRCGSLSLEYPSSPSMLWTHPLRLKCPLVHPSVPKADWFLLLRAPVNSIILHHHADVTHYVHGPSALFSGDLQRLSPQLPEQDLLCTSAGGGVRTGLAPPSPSLLPNLFSC